MHLVLHSVRTLCALSAALYLGGCCTSAKCLERHSSPDKDRVKAKALTLNVVHNDSVSGPGRDRTDWKYIELPRPGKLTVQLHWDTGGSHLQLAVFDVLGMLIQEGRPWGSGGRRAVVAIEEAGRYYIRVRTVSKRDESNYSLRMLFKADRPTGTSVCHKCKVGDRKCLGETGYIVCTQLSDGCNAWTKTFACPAGAPCNEGLCAGCAAECEAGNRRCAGGGRAVQVCVESAKGCPTWSPPESCADGKRCRAGQCVRKGKGPRHPPPPVVRNTDKPPQRSGVKARIISIYRYRGRMTLHLEIGDNPAVKPGQIGVVLAGEGDNPVPGGEIKVSKVAGRYAIATTSLDKLGKNRWVQIKVR